MAIAVASRSTMVKSDYPTASVTLTAPTGITAGDLLLIVVGGQGWHSQVGEPLLNMSRNSGQATCTGFTQATYASYDLNNNTGSGGCARINVLYKIAVLADQSATEYVVTHNSSTYGGGAIMYRITGWSTGNPLAYLTNLSIATTPVSGYAQDGSDVLSWNPSFSRVSQQVLFCAVCTNGDSDFGFNYSTFQTTPSETWLDYNDDVQFNVTNYDGGGFSVAWAVSSATTDITSMSFQKYLDISDGQESTVALLFAVFTPVNASGTSALHSISPSFYANSGTSDGLGTAALLSVSPVINSGSGQSTSNVWTARSKNTTTWTPRN